MLILKNKLKWKWKENIRILFDFMISSLPWNTQFLIQNLQT